jgi:phage I-like protein
VSTVTAKTLYKKIDKVLEGIQADKDKTDSYMEQFKPLKKEENGNTLMRPLKTLPKETVDSIYRQLELSRAKGEVNDVDSVIQSANFFNLRDSGVNVGISSEDYRKLKYVADSKK